MNDIEINREDIGVEETITPSLTVDEAPVPPEESTPSPAPSLADAQCTPVPPCGIFEALARAQAGFRKVIKNRVNPAFKSRYADLEAILDAVRPSLNAQGIFISQDVENEPGAVSSSTASFSVSSRSRRAASYWLSLMLSSVMARLLRTLLPDHA